MFSKQCKAHLEEVGETRLQHLLYAVVIAVKLQLLVPVLLWVGASKKAAVIILL